MSAERGYDRDGFVRPEPPPGIWVEHAPNQVARCPAPRCGRGIGLTFPNTSVRVRVAGIKGGPKTRVGKGVGMFYTCQDNRCRAQLEIEFYG